MLEAELEEADLSAAAPLSLGFRAEFEVEGAGAMAGLEGVGYGAERTVRLRDYGENEKDLLRTSMTVTFFFVLLCFVPVAAGVELPIDFLPTDSLTCFD